MLAAIKQVANDNFLFQQHSALAQCVCNTVQAMQRGILNFLFLALWSQQCWTSL